MNKNAAPVDVKTQGRKIIVEYDQEVSDQAIYALQNQLKEYTELIQLKLEQNSDEIKDVKQTIESDYIEAPDLDALESLVDKKARAFVEKQKGVQLNIDTILNSEPEAIKTYKSLINTEIGKTKSKIWVNLNKQCLERKGTAPKKRILRKQTEQAFDYVRKWGGFSI